MNRFIPKKIREFLVECATWVKHKVKTYTLSRFDSLNHNTSFETLMKSFKSENESYSFFEWVFLKKCPKLIRNHRLYFSKNGRGFGEDAMHGMWWMLLNEFRPKQLLEIGVYRGQTISLWQLVANSSNLKMEIWGISPLSSLGDEVSNYADLDYESDIQQNFKRFGLGTANLLRGLSTDAQSQAFVANTRWDLIYLDGSHDFEVVKHDFLLASGALENGGILVLDDASLFSDYQPPKGSFAGHPGPSLVAREISQHPSFLEIGTCGHNRIYKKIL
jgi:hypothetical protein